MSVSLLAGISKGWLHDNGGFVFGERYYLDPLYRREIDIKIDRFLQQRFPGYAINNLESNLVQADYWQPDYVYVGGIQPNLILGACIGAEIAWYEDKDIDFVDINPLGHITSATELPTVQEILAHPFIKGFDRQVKELQETHPELTIIPPFFWDTSGRATIHGFITTSMKFYGEQIFIKMFEDPEFVTVFHNWLVDVHIDLIRHYSALGKILVTSVHIGECAGAMIRGSQYEQFVIPFVNKIAGALGPIRLHSCGLSNHLLAAMGHIHDLQVLDTGSNTSVSAMREQLGYDLRLDLAPPLEVLREGADKKVLLEWLDEVLIENGAGPLQLGYHLEPGYSFENCLVIHDELFCRGLVVKGRQ
jgi:hypothetical protein